MQGRTWKNIENCKAEEIKSKLLEIGGKEQEVKNSQEIWRIKLSDSTFTYYPNGTLYSTPSNLKDPIVLDAWKQIDLIVGSAYTHPTRDFLVGLDETGKGEIIGHTVLTGIIFPKEIFKELDLIIGPADTKKRHKFEYWDRIFRNLDGFRNSGFDFIEEKIPPWIVDKYNLNKIMDIIYQRILNIFFRRAEIQRCRIVLDDYGIGDTLKRFLNFLKNKGAEIIVSNNSEEKYLEAKIASLISKRTREAVIKAINENSEFKINGLSVGSGNAADKQTLDWLKRWHASGKPWPWFVKRSFKTIRQIEGKPGRPEKMVPPIREDILSQEFKDNFNKGNLSIESLSLVCPSCGEVIKGVKFAFFEKNGSKISTLKCPNCDEFIKDAGITLRYYCGYVIPDSSAIQRSILSNDLGASRFFENFTVILTPVVRKECDNVPRGKNEFKKLWEYNAIGRIKLECVGKVEDLPNDIPNTVRDEKIIDACKEYNAILLTADKSMNTFAAGKNVFTIFI